MTSMKKSLAIAAGVAAIALGSTAASATTTINLTADGSGGYSGFAAKQETTSFGENYKFTVPITGAVELDFQIGKGGYVKSATFDAGLADQATFTYTDGTAGKYTMGKYLYNGIAGTTYTFSLVGKGASGALLTTIAGVSAVPEPASWAMMIGGVGFIGGAMRRRNTRTTVSFA